MKKFALVSLGLLLGSAAFCYGDSIYNVTLNTAPLIGNANGPFALDFQLTDGNTASSVVNTVTASHFTFGTGGSAASGSPQPNSGNAAGNLTSSVALNTSRASFFNEFSQSFNPGSTLTFQLDLTNNPQTGGTPDEFSFYVLDKSSSIPTTDPGGSFFYIDLTGSALSPHVFAANGDGVSIAPQLTLAATVPEPATTFLLLAGAALFASTKRRGKLARRTS